MDVYSNNNYNNMNNMQMINKNKKTPNPQNFKIVKCVNFETRKCWFIKLDGSCKYGSACTYAHGDSELRNKDQNQYYNIENNNPMFYQNSNLMNYDQNNPMLMNFMMQNQFQQMSGFPMNMMGKNLITI